MNRREFAARFLLGALVASAPVSAQPARRVYRIGVLGLGTTSEMSGGNPVWPSMRALIAGMQERGYKYGEHYVTEPRGGAGNPDRFPALAAELVRLNVDVIAAGGGPTIAALRQATATIPIVMAAAADPVADGYVQSLGHPGGNITGLSLQSTEAASKRLDLLKQLVPKQGPVAVFWNAPNTRVWKAIEALGHERGLNLLSIEIPDAGAIDAAFKMATDGNANSGLALAAGVLFTRAHRVAELAAKSRLPVMYELRQYVDAGGLVSYGANINQIWRQAAGFIDKILRGAKPADLPIEQPTKFELVINLRAARTLGLMVPQSVRLLADELIE